MKTNSEQKKTKHTYIVPETAIIKVEYDHLFCAGSNDKASYGATGSQNEVNQDDILTGGPSISGAKSVATWDIWED